MPVNLEDFRKMVEVVTRGNPGDHFHALGITVESVRHGGVVFKLRYSDAVVGNPDTGVIHGGAITALLDSACGMAASSIQDTLSLTPTVDLRIDYMRPAEPGKDVYAECEVYRKTPHVIFTRGLAYQEDKQRPVAHAVGTFTPVDTPDFDGFRERILETYDQLEPAIS